MDSHENKGAPFVATFPGWKTEMDLKIHFPEPALHPYKATWEQLGLFQLSVRVEIAQDRHNPKKVDPKMVALAKCRIEDIMRDEFKRVAGGHREKRFRKLAQIYRHLAITMAVKVEEAMDRQKDPMLVKRSYATKWKAHQKDFDKQAARYLKVNI